MIPQRIAAVLVTQTHHIFSHVGSNNLYANFSKYYWSPKLKQMCHRFCSTCTICLERKSLSRKNQALVLNRARKPFEKVFIDVAGPFEEDHGYKYIFVMIDFFSNYPLVVPLKSLTSGEITKMMFEKWITYFRAPVQIHSDNALYFRSSETEAFLKQYNIKHSLSAPYHPQSNGKVERLMRTMKDMIYSTMKEKRVSWVQSLAKVNISLRCCIHGCLLYTSPSPRDS